MNSAAARHSAKELACILFHAPEFDGVADVEALPGLVGAGKSGAVVLLVVDTMLALGAFDAGPVCPALAPERVMVALPVDVRLHFGGRVSVMLFGTPMPKRDTWMLDGKVWVGRKELECHTEILSFGVAAGDFGWRRQCMATRLKRRPQLTTEAEQ